jgi:outer membrane receptor protein involved in Fe transport
VTSFRTGLLVGAALAAMAGSAFAQTTPPAQPAPARKEEPRKDDREVEGVVVSGQANEIRSSIDSTSYSLAKDLQATTGTLADALRNVPSVDVDPQGNVSLRGDSNVTILVDGRPSGMLSGDGRAQAILSLPADQYARIEVMTNPSAAYSPEGSAGVINLITKPTAPKPGVVATGNVRANIGDEGRWNLGVGGSWQKDALTLNGDVSYRHDRGQQTSDRTRDRLDPLTGDVLSTTRQTQAFGGPANVFIGRLGAEYRLNKIVQLSVELRGNDIDNVGEGPETLETVDALGVTTARYSRDLEFGFQGDNLGTTGRILSRFAEGHEWTNELRVDRSRGHVSFDSVYDFDLPPAADLYEATDNRFNLFLVGFTSAYVRPMPGEGKLRAGYELETRDVTFRQATSRGPAPGAMVPDPFVTNRFEVDQQVHALYTTYERPFGKVSAQLGLRVEYADLELRSVTGGVTQTQDYLRLYPTLHVNWQLTDAQSLKASYSRRIQRPPPFLLNPFTSYQDPLNLRSGNPDLKPQETDAYELMYQLRNKGAFYQATLYFRDTDKAFTEVATDIGGGVLLTRPENLGSRRDLGVELVANGPLTKTLKYNASVNIYRQEIDAVGVIPGARDRSGTVVSGRASLNWQPTPEDFLQLSGFWQGETLLAQGKREAGGMLNVGYRRKIDDKWAFQATVRDLLDDFGDVTNSESATYMDRTERTFGGRAVFVGFTYTFGAGPKKEQPPQFDFSAPPTGG